MKRALLIVAAAVMIGGAGLAAYGYAGGFTLAGGSLIGVASQPASSCDGCCPACADCPDCPDCPDCDCCPAASAKTAAATNVGCPLCRQEAKPSGSE
jgi:hypothetical protein